MHTSLPTHRFAT